MAAAALAAGSLAVGGGWLAAKWHFGDAAAGRSTWQSAGGDHRFEREQPRELRVTGASMAPTLLGLHGRLHCQGCGVQWAAHWQRALRPTGPAICWNCGAHVATDAVPAEPGSLVRVTPLRRDTARLTAGDMVAIELPPHWAAAVHGAATDPAERGASEQSLSIKRIAAGPGQSVTYDRGRLLVDGAPVLPRTIWIPVHDDSHRRDGQSWWEAADSSKSVRQSAAGFRFESAVARPKRGLKPTASAWLLYCHRSVHNQLRPDRIRDDVPGNVSEVRALQPAGPLRLSLCIESPFDAVIEVGFWRPNEPALFRRYPVGAGITRLHAAGPDGLDSSDTAEAARSRQNADPLPQDQPQLGPTELLTIGVSQVTASTAVHISQIRIERALQYTIDPRDAAAWSWPIVLGDDEYYVLGDNVPLSIDSRHFGPIDASRVVGLVQRVSYDDRPR